MYLLVAPEAGRGFEWPVLRLTENFLLTGKGDVRKRIPSPKGKKSLPMRVSGCC